MHKQVHGQGYADYLKSDEVMNGSARSLLQEHTTG